jgi:hypothetical protein
MGLCKSAIRAGRSATQTQTAPPRAALLAVLVRKLSQIVEGKCKKVPVIPVERRQNITRDEKRE